MEVIARVRETDSKTFLELIKNNGSLVITKGIDRSYPYGTPEFDKYYSEYFTKYANHQGHSDTNPFEIVTFLNPKVILIRPMNAERVKTAPLVAIGGFMGHFDNSKQEWKITPNEDAETFKIRLHKNGQWKDANGASYYLSHRPVKFYDHNF